MNKENNASKFERPLVRVTRARAKALGTSSGMVQPVKPFQDQKRVLRVKSKRSEMEENRDSMAAISSFQPKRLAVLRDVTNNALKNQTSEREPPRKIQKLARIVCEKIPPVQEDAKTKLAEELSKIKVAESEEFGMAVELDEDEKVPPIRSHAVQIFAKRDCGLRNPGNKEEHTIYEKSSDSEFVNIDSNLKDPQACSLYAPYIYNNIRLTELERRSASNYMEELQTDISPNMRAILIDWLVEVSEEYNLVPDTLYLTISLIDRYLSRNRIEKQRLQLVGVASMLIASKYEEICAPRAEEFCFITDSTYTRAEVLKMESEILNVLHFHLSVPTTKTFLRRFIKAAQSLNKVPVVELEFLANYLAEMTLVDYNFLKFLPSLIAASAVFLARWTLNESDNPWNRTLEHYTGYKASDLKNAVLAMADLQVNSNSDPRSAVREKYKQQKFKGVATLTSIQPLGTLFQ